MSVLYSLCYSSRYVELTITLHPNKTDAYVYNYNIRKDTALLQCLFKTVLYDFIHLK